MSNTAPNEAIQATSAILAAYAGNPNPNMTPEQLLGFIDKVHGKLTSLAGGTAGASLMSEAARSSLAGSEIFIESRDPATIWPDASPEQREKYMHLIEEHNIQLSADGTPITRRPRHMLVQPDLVFDPISGRGFKMLKRHLTVAYQLDENEMRAMFKLAPTDFLITAPNYSASKAKQAAVQGLGRGNKKSAVADASRKAAAAKPAKASKPAARKAVAKKGSSKQGKSARTTARATVAA